MRLWDLFGWVESVRGVREGRKDIGFLIEFLMKGGDVNIKVRMMFVELLEGLGRG